MNDHVKDDLVAKDIAERLARLCDWAAEASRAPLPEAVRRRAALVLADDIAAIAVASREKQVAAGQAIVMAGPYPAMAAPTPFRRFWPRPKRPARRSPICCAHWRSPMTSPHASRSPFPSAR